MAVPVFTWAAKSAAAAVCSLTACWLFANAGPRQLQPPPAAISAASSGASNGRASGGRGAPPRVLPFWFGVFFAGGAVSAAVGAVLEARYDDLQHGPVLRTRTRRLGARRTFAQESVVVLEA